MMSGDPLSDATNKATDEHALKLKQRQLTARSRQAFEDGNTALALMLLKRAQKLLPSESLARKIARIRAFYDEEQANAGSGTKAENYDKEEEEEERKEKGSRKVYIEDDEEKDRKRRSKINDDNFEESEKTERRRRPKVQDDDSEYEEEEEEEEKKIKPRRADRAMFEVTSGFEMREQIYSKLFAHQREGVAWLWGLHCKKKGGILADDMGLGKTVQIVTFLNALFDGAHIRSALIIAPVSVLATWQREFDAWKTRVRVLMFHEDTKKQRLRNLHKIQRLGGVLMSTYGMLMTSAEHFGSDDNGRDFIWDYVILDEGHKIKNPSNKTTKAAHATPARHRLILTGTAIQNNLMELWALFDFVHFGGLLGTQRSFKTHYETPVLRSRQRDATAGERHYGAEMAASLKQRISPFFLRRTKAQVAQRAPDVGGAPSMPKLSRKNDFIVWLFLTEIQEKIYRDFLQLDVVKELLVQSNKRSPLMELTILKKLCDHPRLLSTFQCVQLGLERGNDYIDLESAHAHQCAANRIHSVSDFVLIQESGKVAFVVGLIDHLREAGHRTLIFSQSRKMLDIIEKVLQTRGHQLLRLDGTVTGSANRQALINRFTEHPERYSAFLLTTQVGGIGLTLTAADRVVIIDPSWNPATDNQAVDRAFRIGQSKNVVIYRLITCGTVEEKIYRRQIFKDSITRQATGSARSDRDPYRYFTAQQLRELFSLDSPRHSDTQQLLARLHEHERISDPHLDAHLAFLHALDIFGLSDHDRMFTREDEAVAEAEVDQLSEHLARTGLSTAQQVAQLRARAEAQLAAEAAQTGGGAERLRQDMERLRLDGAGKCGPRVATFSNTFVSARNQSTAKPTFNSTFANFKPSANSTFIEEPVRQPPIFKPTKSDTSRQMYNKPSSLSTGVFRQLMLDKMVPPPPRPHPPPSQPLPPSAPINISSDSEEEKESKPQSLLTDDDDSIRVRSSRQEAPDQQRHGIDLKNYSRSRRDDSAGVGKEDNFAAVSVDRSANVGVQKEDSNVADVSVDRSANVVVQEEDSNVTDVSVDRSANVGVQKEDNVTDVSVDKSADVGVTNWSEEACTVGKKKDDKFESEEGVEEAGGNGVLEQKDEEAFDAKKSDIPGERIHKHHEKKKDIVVIETWNSTRMNDEVEDNDSVREVSEKDQESSDEEEDNDDDDEEEESGDDEIGSSEEEAWEGAVERSAKFLTSPVTTPRLSLHAASTPLDQWRRRSGSDSPDASVSDDNNEWELRDIDEEELERSLHRPEIAKLISRSLPGTPRRVLVGESDSDSELGIADTPDATGIRLSGVGDSF